MSAAGQLILGLGGTRHVCAHYVRAVKQCGRAWECDEPDCQGSEQEACPSCSPFPRPHSTWWATREKREPQIAAKLQRMAARRAVA